VCHRLARNLLDRQANQYAGEYYTGRGGGASLVSAFRDMRPTKQAIVARRWHHRGEIGTTL
jgi:hypothetical protein